MKKEYKRKGFLLYNDDVDLFRQLTNTERGRLIMALFEYFIDGTVASGLDGMTNVVFTVLKRNIDRDRDKYQRACERRRESQRKRWKQKTVVRKQVDYVDNVQNVHIPDNETKTKTQNVLVLVNEKSRSDVPPSMDGRRTSSDVKNDDLNKRTMQNKNDTLKNDGFFQMSKEEKIAYLENKRRAK